MAYQDPTTYDIEPDPLVYTARTSVRCTCTDLLCNVHELVYDDKGAGHFDGDYEHLIDIYVDAIQNKGGCKVWALANEVDDFGYFKNTKDLHSVGLWRTAAGERQLSVREDYDDGGGGAQVDYYVISEDTSYYCKPKRVEGGGVGDLRCYIYSDSDRTDLLDELHLELVSSTAIDWRYVYMVMSLDGVESTTVTFYCENLDLQEYAAPTVTAQAVSAIGTTTATGNGTITDDGGENCDKRGICWNTEGNPDVNDDKSEETDSFGTGAFSRAMTGLTPGQHYYVKAYAHNSAGYGYSDQVEFYTNKECTGSDSGSGAEAKASGSPVATITKAETGSGADISSLVAALARSETGQGAEASSEEAAIVKGDSGSGAEASSEEAAITKADSGEGSEASSEEASFPVRSDTGSGVDARLSFLVALAKSDSGTGQESLLNRFITLIQSSTGVEQVIARLLTTGQAASGVDVSHLVKTLLLSDSGSGVENSYLHILSGVKTSADTGSGVDASSLLVPHHRSETGLAVDQVVSRALYAKEYPTGATDLAKSLQAALTGAETGTGAEASLASYYQKLSESGAGADSSLLSALFHRVQAATGQDAKSLYQATFQRQDAGEGVEQSEQKATLEKTDSGIGEDSHKSVYLCSTGDSGSGIDACKELSPRSKGETGTGVDKHIEVKPISQGDSAAGADVSTLISMFVRTDAGAGAEAITVLASMLSHDTGYGVDSILEFLRHLVDSGQGVEVVNLLGAIGKAMKLIAYLRTYTDLVVYTKPYSQLKVYVREVKQ